jgi:hypothetical protein
MGRARLIASLLDWDGRGEGESMENGWAGLPPGWMDWLTVVGYVGFMLFVIWQVIVRSDRRS